MSDKIFENLNDKQIEAVKVIDGPVLVISGPGSGKTRCLTHRVAYLIREGIPPQNILAVTFTNKAAGEMRERVSKLLEIGNWKLEIPSALPMVGTFHSIGLRILRQEIPQLGYRRNFTVFDEDDQLALVKRVMGDLEIDTKSFNPKIVLAKISELKTKLVFPEDYEPKDFYPEIVAKVYKKYQQELKDHNAVDFDDLIVLPIKIFRQNGKTLSKYQEWWRYILVDEYQDTSYDQYILINLLAQKYRNLFAIGDDAQCLLPETKITTKTGSKEIKDITVGEEVLSPAGLGNTFYSEVTAIKKSYYKGPIIEIRTKLGYILRSTPNHILFGKLLPSKNFFITYLMYSETIGYRIGITVGERHPRSGKPALGLRVRANQEKSDKIWILKISSSRADAQYWEAYYAFKYGIPTTVFFANRGKGSKNKLLLTQKHIDNLFDVIPSTKRAANLMADQYIFHEYPHHRPQATMRYQTRRIAVNLNYFGADPGLRTISLFRGARISINNRDETIKKLLTKEGFNVRRGKARTWRVETARRDNGKAELLAEKISSLCNVEISKNALITDLRFTFLPASQIHPHMTVPIFNGRKIINDKVTEIKKLDYNGSVYDLNVKKTHTYIANDFAVHNSIYQFRRADIRNILNYQKDYPEAQIILLEQNYRSTKNIITAAQGIISNNKNQIPKELWTDNDHGEKITIAETINERHEATFVISKIEDLSSRGYKIKDFAVLYRTHAQSRALEEAFIMRGFPYQIVGGLKFYDRKEIKDMLAYLRLVINPSDTLAIERIYNIPPRGIGKATIEKVRKGEQGDIVASLALAIENKTMPPRQLLAVSDFYEILTDIRKTAEDKKLATLIKYIIKKTKYEDYLKEFSLAKPIRVAQGGQNDYENFEDRMENLKELLTVASKFEGLSAKEGAEKFLEEVTLLQQNDRIKSSGGDATGKITLMTVHASKGLEFPVIFIVGMEEGLFPHSRTIINPSELEEERRLCYVATTRAKEHLILTYTKFRNIFGSHSMNLPSRFIGEIPPNLVDYQLLDPSYDDDDKIYY